jgi:hypothetical protein
MTVRLERLNTYAAYSIGCAIVWGLIWLIAGATATEEKRRELRSHFFGWVSGLTSATIARSVSPPPKRSWSN